MSLKDVKIEKLYRNLSNDVINNFYIPVLRETVVYKRAVGFFNSSALYEIATGLQQLIANNGRIQLIVSPKLEEEDVEAIIKGYKTREEVIANSILREFKEPINIFQHKKLNLLANLIADEKLDIKVAFKQDVNSVGIFHEKIGIMEDMFGNKVAFGGSMNETYSGLLQNYESIDVFCSWLQEDSQRVQLKEEDFDDLWNNIHYAMEVVDFPKVAIEKLNTYKNESTSQIFESVELNKFDTYEAPRKKQQPFFRVPTLEQGFKGFYDYQEGAISEWARNKFKGIFNMATGTGKTLTALGAVSNLSKVLSDKLCVFIVCPYQHLVEQWCEDIRWFGVEPIICNSNYKWKDELKNKIRYFNLGIEKNFCVITCNATFSTPFMQEMVDKVKGNMCLVVDEAHNFGAKKQRLCMKTCFKYRLALSATLDRHHDEEGTEALRTYFGNECINYPLSRAIREDKLTPYYYYPIPITLEDDELIEYNKLSERISKLLRGHKSSDPLPANVEMLLIKRARIIAGARNKLKKLFEIMKDHKDDKNMLVYCGATKVFNNDYSEDFDDDLEIQFDGEKKRQIEIVVSMLGNQLGMSVNKFTAEENAEKRELLKTHFASGKLQCLVAIKCLDEGVNIPGINTAFILASSTNPKEYIQRRGRVLRKAENKARAYIYDFITLPHELDGYVNPSTAQYELSLIKKEKERMEDFEALADNPTQAIELIEKIDELYDLNTIGGYDDEF